MRIVVIGGSGLVGAKLVSILQLRDHDVLAASPRSGVNTLTGEGLAEALAGARAVVDVTNSRARYFGAELSDDTLTPDEGAILGVTRFDEWLTLSPAVHARKAS
jgi:uncharacterized protein YbjT (DUF2867 family)